MGLISGYVVNALGRVITDQYDLGDWLCKVMGICA